MRLDAGRRLTWVQVWRLAVLGSLCAFGIAVLGSSQVRDAYLAAAAVLLGNSILYLLLSSRKPESRLPAWLLCCLDAFVIGVIVHYAGGIDGPFAMVFVLHAMLAGYLLGVRGGAWIAMTDTLILALSGMLTLSGRAPAEGSAVIARLGLDAPADLSGQYIALRVFLHALLLLSVGLVSGYLTELLRRQSGRLQNALEALKASRAGSRDILENLADGILVLDSGGHPLRANASLCRMLSLGEDWEQKVRETQLYRLLAGYRKAGAFPDNIDLVTDDRILECRMGMFTDSYGEEPGAMAILSDVTEIRHLQSRLEEREKLAVVGRLSATMAHEIRNPLASISGAAQVIRTGGLDEAGEARMIDMIINQSRRASDIIEGYLEVARSGKAREESEIRLDMLIRGVVEGARNSYARNVEIRLHPMPETTIRGREQRLLQVFENLLRNSAEALDSSSDGRIEIELVHRDDRVRVTLRDNGPGMPPETLARASEPFFTTKELGIGLGLYVARRVAEEHGGSVSFSAVEGGGLSVTVDLPENGAGE